MREIKFRAWDGDRLFYIERFSQIPSNWRDAFHLMQYTGLRDKNGKEIYEGDILHWVGLKLPITVDDFHGYRFMFGKDSLCRAFAIEGEVIGNIYENPELLK